MGHDNADPSAFMDLDNLKVDGAANYRGDQSKMQEAIKISRSLPFCSPRIFQIVFYFSIENKDTGCVLFQAIKLNCILF